MSWTAGRHWPAQGVKLTGLTKKSVFRAENGIFFKSSFYTKMICDPKYNFSLGQKYLVVASFKVSFFHQIQPMYLHVRRTVPFTFTHFEGSLAPHTSSREYGNVCWTPARQKRIRQTKMF